VQAYCYRVPVSPLPESFSDEERIFCSTVPAAACADRGATEAAVLHICVCLLTSIHLTCSCSNTCTREDVRTRTRTSHSNSPLSRREAVAAAPEPGPEKQTGLTRGRPQKLRRCGPSCHLEPPTQARLPVESSSSHAIGSGSPEAPVALGGQHNLGAQTGAVDPVAAGSGEAQAGCAADASALDPAHSTLLRSAQSRHLVAPTPRPTHATLCLYMAGCQDALAARSQRRCF
jgi:hypothetical protein